MTTDEYLARAIELSRSFEDEPGLTPFGAVVVLDGQIIGEGISSVGVLVDPTAHAEVLAIRQACRAIGNHLLQGATLYSSAYPCPLCLMACYWSQVASVWYAAELEDSAPAGFEDTEFYRELTLPPAQRSLPVRGVGGTVRATAAGAIADWHTAWQREAERAAREDS